MHHEEILKAAAAGKHMIIEKPICMNEKELQDLLGEDYSIFIK